MTSTQDSDGGRSYPPPGRIERLWPAQLAIAAVIVVQLLLPNQITVGPRWLLPSLEAALLIALVFASPREIEGMHARRRRLALLMIGFVTLVNISDLVLLTHELLHHRTPQGRPLIIAGSLIWLTNVVVFAVWYWETDRGGPGVRAAGRDGPPDLLFPQMTDDRIEPPNWRPGFIDYLYVALTNATAFSPTDTMPLTPMAKSVMGVQSLVSLVTIALVVSRAVNILQ
jgi:hypothetical protein